MLKFERNFELIFKKQIINRFKCSAATPRKDTIYSLSSGYGKCGVAVIRVSGQDCTKTLNKIAGFKSRDSITPRCAYLRNLRHPLRDEVIDRGLVLWFPGPKSFTGEDCCEYQVHGGTAIIAALIDALNSIRGLRQARAGEFTKRAFYAGKLDLTECEGLADLIHAETEQQRKQALRQANGSVRKLYNEWRQILLKSIAHIEAYIDFAEDQNIESDILPDLCSSIERLEGDIANHLNDGRRGELLRNGVRTAILGAPNVGKSSFMNRICCRPISIVTNIEGTTRDILESSYNIAGYPVVFADTAGLRLNATDPIELEGINRALNYARLSDLIILLMDVRKLIEHNYDIETYKQTYLKEMGWIDNDNKFILILNKIDLITADQLARINASLGRNATLISCMNGEGIENAVQKISQQLKDICGEVNGNTLNISQQRHRFLLENCREYLQTFSKQLSDNKDLAITAHQLRLAVRCIGQITGDVSSEEIFNVIFKEFCIGK